MSLTEHALTEHQLRRIAAEADVDPRTVRRMLVDGHQPRSRATHAAICRALKTLGFAELLTGRSWGTGS